MKYDEFEKLSSQEKEQLLANAEALQKAQEGIQKEEAGLKQLSMKDFENKVKEVVENAIKPMTKVDRKHFAFPGIGEVENGSGPEVKFAKTKRFFSALTKGDVATANAMHQAECVKANLSEGAASAGGYLVPEEFKAEILRLAPLYGVIRANARMIPMRYDVLNIPAAGPTDQSAIWTNEAAQILQTNPDFGQVTLTLKKLAAIPKVTSELLEDADVSIVQYLAELIAEQFAKAEDKQGFNGIGAPFIGALESTGSPTFDACTGTIGSLGYSQLVRLTGDLYANALSGAKYYLHRSIIAHVKSIITTAGAPVFPSSMNDIVGYPLVSTEALVSYATLGASTASYFGIFGDLRRGYAMGERGSITMKLSTEATVDSDNLFEKDMVALRMIERVAMGVLITSYWLRLYV
jgi:HK97 family phage major capsid protein